MSRWLLALLLLLPFGALAQNGNLSGGSVIATGATTARTLADRFADTVNVKDSGAVGNGSTDDTSALVTAIAKGGNVIVPAGNYKVSGPVTVPSNTRIVCSKGAVFTAAAAANWPGGNINNFLQNGGAVSNIEITGCRFAWPLPGNWGSSASAHIIAFDGTLGAVSNIIIDNNVSDGGGNFTAFVGASQVFEYANSVTNVGNACYDHWGGFTDVHVNGNYCATGTIQAAAGIQFTGINTDQSAANSSAFEAIGNTVIAGHSDGQAININGHASTGTDDMGRIEGNLIMSLAGVGAWGVLVTGHVHHVIIANNSFRTNVGSYSAVGAYSPANDVIVHDNQAVDWAAGASGVYSNGTGGSTHDNMAINSSSPTYAVMTGLQYANDDQTGTWIMVSPSQFIAAPMYGTNTNTVPLEEKFNMAANHAAGQEYETAGVIHWYLGTDGTTQSGGDLGDNYIIENANDGGGPIGIAFQIDRASGHTVLGSFTGVAVTSGSTDCGTSASIAGNDNIGRITVGSSTNGGKCTVTFAKTWQTNAPVCTAQNETTGNLIRPSPSTTQLVLNGTLTAADKISYHCTRY